MSARISTAGERERGIGVEGGEGRGGEGRGGREREKDGTGERGREEESRDYDLIYTCT